MDLTFQNLALDAGSIQLWENMKPYSMVASAVILCVLVLVVTQQCVSHKELLHTQKQGDLHTCI